MSKDKMRIKASYGGVTILDQESDLDKIENVFDTIKKKVR